MSISKTLFKKKLMVSLSEFESGSIDSPGEPKPLHKAGPVSVPSNVFLSVKNMPPVSPEPTFIVRIAFVHRLQKDMSPIRPTFIRMNRVFLFLKIIPPVQPEPSCIQSKKGVFLSLRSIPPILPELISILRIVYFRLYGTYYQYRQNQVLVSLRTVYFCLFTI